MKIKRRVKTTKPAQQGNMPYGVEYWYTKFNQWTDSLESPVVFWRNFGLALLTVIAMVGLANLLPFSQAVQSYFVVPASLVLFLSILAATRRILSDEHLGVRERYSAKQRRSFGIPVVLLSLGIFVFANSYLPYLLGGLVFMTLIFALYNAFRRTPEEIIMDMAGVADPRDLPEEYEEEINDEIYESAEEQLAIEDPFAGGGLINTDIIDRTEEDNNEARN